MASGEKSEAPFELQDVSIDFEEMSANKGGCRVESTAEGYELPDEL